MKLRHYDEERRYNFHFLSHKCPLNGANFTEDQVNFPNENKNHPAPTSSRYHCKGFHRVCMIMGVLVLMDVSENGVVSIQELMPQDFSLKVSSSNKRLNSRDITKVSSSSNGKFTIPSSLLNQPKKQ